MTVPQPYRIGWGLLARLVARYRPIVPMIVRGRQGDGQRVPRRKWWSMIRRDLRNLVTGHPKRLVHVPWQAEIEGLRFARRGLTPARAVRRVVGDYEHERRTGRRAPYQALRWRLARRWDRKNLPSGVTTPDPTPQVATSCASCGNDIGLWDPPKLSSGYTHIRPGGGPRWDLNGHHEVAPSDYVPFPPDWR